MLAITQRDHAELAGALAAAWGNERAWRPEPWDDLVTASHRHDDGWIEWDANPTLNDFEMPYDFITLPTPDRVNIYRRGVEVVRNETPHAQLLVSMHLVGLFLGRLQPESPKLIDSLAGPDRELVDKFIAEQDVWGREPPLGMTAQDLLAQYRLLQVFDLMSLVLCLTPAGGSASNTVGLVPMEAPGTNVTTVDMMLESGGVTLDPYPLASEGVEVGVTGRVISSDPFEDVDSYRSALADAPTEDLRFTIGAP